MIRVISTHALFMSLFIIQAASAIVLQATRPNAKDTRAKDQIIMIIMAQTVIVSIIELILTDASFIYRKIHCIGNIEIAWVAFEQRFLSIGLDDRGC